ncbi:hypothetical protein V8J88_00230 [Massilia sp. W12]|uniref:hypothetical protein n=1 Tax=Massilia sp. W12 TaxID=3126507 RepID=UPI0030D00C75
MDAATASKYGLKYIPKTEVVRPKNLQSLNDDNVDIIEIAKRVMEEHKEVLDALAKR